MSELDRPIARPACEQLDLSPAGPDSVPDRYGLALHSMACFSPDAAQVEVGKVLGAVQQWATEPVPSRCDQAYSSDARLRPIETLTGMSACRVGELSAEALGAGAGLWGMTTKKTGLRLIKGAADAKKVPGNPTVETAKEVGGKKLPSQPQLLDGHASPEEIFQDLMPKLEVDADLRTAFLHAFTAPHPKAHVHRINGYFVVQDHRWGPAVISVYSSSGQLCGLRTRPWLTLATRDPELAEQVLGEVTRATPRR